MNSSPTQKAVSPREKIDEECSCMLCHCDVLILVNSKKSSISDYNEDEDYTSQGSVVDSRSNEVFNVSLKSKPARINVGIFVNEANITAKPPFHDCNDKHYTNLQKSEEHRRCKHTLANYPFSVSIQRKGSHYASGALIDKRWVLSVAREFYNVRESIKWFKARMGSVNCKRGGTVIPLSRIEIHPDYVKEEPSYDLSLLRLAKPVEYTDFIRPIGLTKIRSRVVDANFLITYWPKLIVNGKLLPATAKERVKSNSMRVSTQKLIPWDKCSKKLLLTGVSLNENSLCLKPLLTHHSICMPDVGAPVVAEDGLWGVISGWVAEQCQQTPSPTIFTRISSMVVRNWMDKYRLIP